MINRKRPARPSSYDKKVALVLQGGGALGSYQAGVYEALASSEYPPDWVAGISIGVINAPIIAGNAQKSRVARLRSFWNEVTTPSFLSHPGHERILRRRRRRVFHREGGKGFFGNGVWIRLPAVGMALGAAGSAGESMATPVASSSPHENPRTEPSGVQAASRSYR